MMIDIKGSTKTSRADAGIDRGRVIALVADVLLTILFEYHNQVFVYM